MTYVVGPRKGGETVRNFGEKGGGLNLKYSEKRCNRQSSKRGTKASEIGKKGGMVVQAEKKNQKKVNLEKSLLREKKLERNPDR